jgi:hypothetical protein
MTIPYTVEPALIFCGQSTVRGVLSALGYAYIEHVRHLLELDIPLMDEKAR